MFCHIDVRKRLTDTAVIFVKAAILSCLYLFSLLSSGLMYKDLINEVRRMRSLQKIFFLFLITVFCAPSYATTSSVELPSCGVFSEAESSSGDTEEKKEEEEEPDCE